MKVRAFLIICLAAAGCAPQPEIRSAPDGAQSARCPMEPHHFVFLGTDTNVFRQGTTVRLIPRYDMSPFGTRDIPIACTSRWSVTGPARLSPDRSSLTIHADAPPGAEIVLSFRFGSEESGARLRVVARDEVVLTGTRGQRGIEGCEGVAPVRELEFSPGNRFAVTFMPFETYKDYWGSYTFDAATGALRMSVAGGNNVPSGLDLEGSARFDAGGRLILEGLYLGNHTQNYTPPPGGCRYIF